MKKAIILLLALLLLLTGCDVSPNELPPAGALPETTAPLAASKDTLPAESSSSEETLPPHSPLYMDGLSTDAVILYFQEVCLDAEIINSGDPSCLQKWGAPILYQILGDPTPEDLDTLSEFAQWLNTIPGFPGMREAEEGEAVNLDIHFCDRETMANTLGDWTLDMDGAVTFWYDMDIIYSATICVRSDIGQELRNAVILEEIYNGLGPIQDTDLREDSIIWSGYSQPQWLSDEDMLIMMLLYHPDLIPGMDAAQCGETIRELYY